MKKIGFLNICILVSLSLMVISCNKEKINTEIQGSWNKEVFDIQSPYEAAIWHFNDGILIIDNINYDLYDDTAKFVVVEKSLKTHVRISGLKNQVGLSSENGDWQVLQYKKDKLTLTKPEESHVTGQQIGTMVREFIRL
jgi:hypothetical protein